jgi:hypothetical protein
MLDGVLVAATGQAGRERRRWDTGAEPGARISARCLESGMNNRPSRRISAGAARVRSQDSQVSRVRRVQPEHARYGQNNR